MIGNSGEGFKVAMSTLDVFEQRLVEHHLVLQSEL